MAKEVPLKIKGTFDDVLAIAGKYRPKANKPKRKSAKRKATKSKR